MEGYVSDGFKTAVVTPLIKKATLLMDDLKNYHPESDLVSHQNWLNKRLLSSW